MIDILSYSVAVDWAIGCRKDQDCDAILRAVSRKLIPVRGVNLYYGIFAIELAVALLEAWRRRSSSNTCSYIATTLSGLSGSVLFRMRGHYACDAYLVYLQPTS